MFVIKITNPTRQKRRKNRRHAMRRRLAHAASPQRLANQTNVVQLQYKPLTATQIYQNYDAKMAALTKDVTRHTPANAWFGYDDVA